MSKNKIFFLVIAIIIVFLMIIWWIFLLTWSKKSKITQKKIKEFNIWVVWDETSWYSDIIKWFKNKYKEYSSTEINVTKFNDYTDYEKTILNVMWDNNSPDIFVINNNWWALLEQKINAIPDKIINTNDFSNKFNRAFDNLIIKNKEKDKDWKNIDVYYLKWVPMWFETLWVFYNWKLIQSIWKTWSSLDDEIKKQPEDRNYIPIALWLWWKYIFSPWDILSLLFLQNKVNNYSDLNNNNWINSLSAYFSYANDINNNIVSLKEEMDELNLTTVDMFVRWKIWILIWYPSLLKEIELAVKRASSNLNLDKKTVKSSDIFQLYEPSKDKTWINLINYNYFALSKLSKNTEMWYLFLSYLSTKESQEKYMESFNYYLPALKELEETRLNKSINSNYERIKYSSFLPQFVELKDFNKLLKTDYDYYLNKNLNNLTEDKKNILNKLIKYINCNKGHLIDMVDFDKKCES